MNTRCTLVLVVVLALCGCNSADSLFEPLPGSAGSTSASSSSASATVGTSSAGTGASSTTAASSTGAGGSSTSSPASASATSGTGGAGGAGGGSEYSCGGVGEPPCPTCPAADCPPAGEPALNCDPACGAVSPACSSACGGVVDLQPGILWVRTPPAYAQSAACVAECSFWSLLLKLPNYEVSFSVDGAPGISVASAPHGDPAPSACSVSLAGICTSGQSPADPGAQDVYLALGSKAATNGELFRVEVQQGGCCPMPTCGGGCNGSGS